jgi:CRISPR/Cas system CMR subunit Cmr6 (Cas7 group RAMP superfamily)
LDAVTILRYEIKQGHDIIEQAVAGLPPEQLYHHPPGSTIQSIAAVYVHAVMAEDRLINGKLRAQPTLFEREGWAEKLGIEMLPFSGDFDAWAATMPNCDFTALREYAARVYDETDDHLATLSDAELDGTVTFVDEMPIGGFLGNVIAWHAVHHGGEICALKGVLGGKGLPF